jgi:HK97 gp10 family phage protein
MLQVSIEGQNELSRIIKNVADKAPEHLATLLYDGAVTTHANALKSIQEHQSQGEVYSRAGIVHVASTAGNAPNSDTGNLASNITIQQIQGGYDVGSRVGAPYGIALEFGTSKMAARPWLAPAFNAALEHLSRVADRILKGAIK